MFSLDFYIDSFQNMKKTMTDSLFTDETLNKIAHNYIDAQTVFAKMLTKNTIDVTKYSIDSSSKYWFPYKKEN